MHQPSHMNNLVKHDQSDCLFSANKRHVILSDWNMAYFTCSLFKKKESNKKKPNMLFMYFKLIFVYGIHMCYTLFKALILET